MFAQRRKKNHEKYDVGVDIQDCRLLQPHNSNTSKGTFHQVVHNMQQLILIKLANLLVEIEALANRMWETEHAYSPQ